MILWAKDQKKKEHARKMGAGQPKENLEMEDSLLSPNRLPLISWFDRFSIDWEPEKK